uniref:Uncharacterized protein n=1 Tax=Salix viminalis TaxID=40686 RepID=A0A6N2NIN9_SALVM
MATSLLTRSLLLQNITSKTLISSILSRPFTSLSATSSTLLRRSLRPLSAAANINRSVSRISIRSFSVKPSSSSLNDPSPNWSNRPPKETILLDAALSIGSSSWISLKEIPLVTRSSIIILKPFLKLLEVRKKRGKRSIQFLLDATLPLELWCPKRFLTRLKLKNVRWVLPDSYLDVKNKDYGGEPFIDGKAVPYDPKYHEEWIRNNARANERNRRNDRPRNVDRSRNFDRRRENMQQRDGAPPPPPMANQAFQNPAPNVAGQPQNMGRQGGPPPSPQNSYRVGPGGPPPNNYNMGGPPNIGGPPPNNYAGWQQNNINRGPQNVPPQNSMPPQNNYVPPQNNYIRPQNMPPQNNMLNMGGWSNDMPGNMQHNFQSGPNDGGYQGGPPNYQNNYPPSRD